jgi:hypothetical protein
VLLRDRVCLRDICINTLLEGDSGDDNNNNNNILRMWNLKCTIIPVIIGANGVVTKSLRKNPEAIPG